MHTQNIIYKNELEYLEASQPWNKKKKILVIVTNVKIINIILLTVIQT